MTGRGPGTGGPGRGGNPGSPGNSSGPGRPGRPGRPGAGGRRAGQGPGQGQPGAGQPGAGNGQGPLPRPRRPGDPRAAAGQNPGLPAGRATGPGPRLPQDRSPGRDRPSGPQPRVPEGRAAGRPGPRRPSLRGAARRGRPRRRPRWLTFQRGDSGRRVGITLLAATIVLTLFAGRLVQLQGLEAAYYKRAAKVEQLIKVPLPAVRGTIYGSNGQILAMTIDTYTIAADPTMIPDAGKPAVAQQLAGPLGMPAAQVLSLLNHPTSRQYVKLAAGVPTPDEEKIAALNNPALITTPHFARVYPNGNATANVVGLTHVNPKTGVISGYAGIEEEYNQLLTGTNGSEEVETNPGRGQAIPLAGAEDTPAKDGESIKLTINPQLQYEAQQACQQEVAKAKAQNCSVVVMQPKTGAILAMAQWPNRADGSDIADQYMFAPGSTAKVVTAAAAFENSSVTPMTAYNIPYAIYRGGQQIHDAEWSPGEHYTVAGIIANSSNIGMSQVVASVPPQIQYGYLKNFGLGEPAGLGLPGEEPSASYAPYALPPPSKWAADERYTLSYGQGIAVNNVQMASVYATIANGGVRVQPTLIAGTYNAAGQYVPARPSPSRRVIQPETAKELLRILQQVPGVDNQANQRWGDIAGYAVAAKTGTSNEPSSDPGKPCPKSNPLCVYGASYIGMAPGNGPQVVVAVNVQNPKTAHAYFGDMVAGPVFYGVMNFALQALQIQPQPGLVAPHVRLNAR